MSNPNRRFCWNIIAGVLMPATLAINAFGQTIIYVDDNAPDGGNGDSWETAFNDLHDALAVTPTEAVEVRLAQGTYKPGATTNAKYVLVSNTTIKGGYAGLEGRDPDERDINAYESILTGDINDDDAPGFVNYENNNLQILVATDLVNAGLDGITVCHSNGQAFRCRSSAMNIVGCTFRENRAGLGAAINLRGPASPTLSGCVFRGNMATLSSAAIYVPGSYAVTHFEMTNCVIADNVGGSVGAVSLVIVKSGLISHCKFVNNVGGPTAGALVLSRYELPNPTVNVIACEFLQNQGEFVTGGMVSQCDTFITNCVFCGNTADLSGAYAATGSANSVITNCSFNGNGVISILNEGSPMAIANSILWGSGTAISQSGIPATISIDYSNVQGGWSGSGSNNINSEPLFIQPGCCNLRLGIGSPCIDVGDNNAIPAGITTDLDGNPRIINKIVDMGASEGEHEMLPSAACASDIDEGEFVQLTPQGGPFNPLLKPAVSILNESAQNDAYATVTEFEAQLHPGAGGFNELGDELSLETSLVPGAYFSRIYINFDQSNLNGFDPLDLDLTHFNPASGKYELAAANNIQSSPGHKGALGDRHVFVGTAWQAQLNFEIGDYGVVWNPDQQKGFAWANVDHASDFAFGVPLPECAGDCTYPSDGVVDVSDLVLVMVLFGMGPAGPTSFADITHNGVIDVDDLLAVINAWGACD